MQEPKTNLNNERAAVCVIIGLVIHRINVGIGIDYSIVVLPSRLQVVAWKDARFVCGKAASFIPAIVTALCYCIQTSFAQRYLICFLRYIVEIGHVTVRKESIWMIIAI